MTTLRLSSSLVPRGAWAAGAMLVSAAAGIASDEEIKYDVHVPSKVTTVNRGVYGTHLEPVTRVKSGATVKIDIANNHGINRDNPRKFFTDRKIPLDLPVVQDVLEIMEKSKPDPSGLTGALLTGPIYIEEAEPGDTLEVRIHDIRYRSSYGTNSTSQTSGNHPLSDLLPRPWTKFIPIDVQRGVAVFKEGEIELPLAPFSGQMGVAPPLAAGKFAAGPPTQIHGGNFDLQELTRGATLYLPVNVKGAYFFTGNGHGLQGNGEINGPGLETSLTTYLQFIVHKDRPPLACPWAETPTHYIFMGMHDSLDDCVRQAALQSVEFLQKQAKLDFYDAYALTSSSVDFAVSRALVPMQMAFAYVPKHIFKTKSEYWYKGPVPTKY